MGTVPLCAMSILTTILLIHGLSQLYWGWRGYSLAVARIPSRGRRVAVCGAVLAAYLLVWQFTFIGWRERGTPVHLTMRDALHLTMRDALLAAPFLWRVSSSLIASL